MADSVIECVASAQQFMKENCLSEFAHVLVVDMVTNTIGTVPVAV